MKFLTDILIPVGILLAVLAGLAWFNIATYRAWRGTGDLDNNGVKTTGFVESKEVSKMVRSIDSYWATVKWYAPRGDGFDEEYSARIQVDQSTYLKLTEGGQTTIVYPAGNPEAGKITGNSNVMTRVIITLVIDAAILLALAWIWMQARKSGNG